MKPIEPRKVFSEENGLTFNQDYDFNKHYLDFDQNKLYGVLSEISNILNVQFGVVKHKFTKYDVSTSKQRLLHPRELWDYFDKVGIEISVWKIVGGWKYLIEADGNDSMTDVMFPTRSSAEYAALIEAMNFRNEQITPDTAEFSKGSIEEQQDQIILSVYGLQTFGSPIPPQVALPKIPPKGKFKLPMGKINGKFCYWFINYDWSTKNRGVLEVFLYAGIEDRETTDCWYFEFK